MKCIKKEYEIGHNTGFLSLMGGNRSRDIAIYDNCNTTNSNFTNLGDSYEAPNGYAYGSNEAMNYLAGSYNFMV